MANTQISISQNGKTTLATAGKYCERNIDINVAVANAEDNLPDYVKAEADSLASKVVSAQGNRVFTLAAITDLHYGNGSYTDGILHASQALSYIRKQITLDAFAVLGDYTDGYPIDDVDNAFGDNRKVNSLLSPMEAIPNLRVQGNHDFYSGYSQFVHYHIQAYSEGVTWGDKNGGYFYRDFADKKLRIICVNTTETDNVRLTVSDAQYNWFIGALDLSAKSDASDWQILVLSHHPLDWYATNFVFCYIVKAYEAGNSWSSGNVSCNFAGKNSAKLIGNIHGHIHNLLVDKIHIGNTVNGNRTSVMRMATPEACIGRANQYNYDGWDEATTYSKVKNSADDTSFVVYCIDLDNQSIKAFCYGAGYDREISYATVAPITYSITNNLTNCTASGVSTITEGGIATVTISANSGYELPDAITVSGASYSWDNSSGTVTLSNPTSNVTVTAVAVVAKPKYTNQIPLSINADGSQFVGTNGEDGYKTGYRLNSSGTETTTTSTTNAVTGFIKCTPTSVIRFKNMTMNYNTSNGAYVAVYDSSFAKIISQKIQDGVQNGDKGMTFDDSGNLLQVHDPSKFAYAYGAGGSQTKIAYIRVSADPITSSSIVTVDEVIE